MQTCEVAVIGLGIMGALHYTISASQALMRWDLIGSRWARKGSFTAFAVPIVSIILRARHRRN